jgi:hypothetical protein
MARDVGLTVLIRFPFAFDTVNFNEIVRSFSMARIFIYDNVVGDSRQLPEIFFNFGKAS